MELPSCITVSSCGDTWNAQSYDLAHNISLLVGIECGRIDRTAGGDGIYDRASHALYVPRISLLTLISRLNIETLRDENITIRVAEILILIVT